MDTADVGAGGAASDGAPPSGTLAADAGEERTQDGAGANGGWPTPPDGEAWNTSWAAADDDPSHGWGIEGEAVAAAGRSTSGAADESAGTGYSDWASDPPDADLEEDSLLDDEPPPNAAA